MDTSYSFFGWSRGPAAELQEASMGKHHYDPTRPPGPGISKVIPIVKAKLEFGPMTMVQLRRSIPEATSTTIGKAIGQLQHAGEVDSDGRRPKRYRVVWKEDA